MSDTEGLKEEIHQMRCDFKSLSGELTELTKVLIRKEENDKYLEGRIEKLELEDKEKEKRIRATEDFITKSNPWITVGAKIFLAAAVLGSMIWLGLK